MSARGGIDVEDRLLILELLARYNHAVDDGDAARYVATFVGDGELRIGDTLRFAGAEQLAGVANSPARVRGQHVTVNVVIDDGTDGRAVVRSYAQMLALAGDPPLPAIVALGRFDDIVVRHDGEWRFEQRVYRDGI